MNIKALNYANQNINISGQEYGVKSFIDNGKLWIEFPSGRNLELSESEILYQANEYLESEKQMLNF
jgi:hypothetical protein